MVSLTTIRSQNSVFLSTHPLVAVFTGGTSGLGEYAIRSLVQAHASTSSPHSLRIYIVGRNASAALKTITDCNVIAPGKEVELIFVKAEDLSLLKDVGRVCEEIMRMEREKEDSESGSEKARIDWLCMSQSNSVQSFKGKKISSEGLDTQFSLHYYSRIRLITLLLPLLLSSLLPTGARITSIYAAGMESSLYPTDISLRTHYSFTNVRSHVVYMTTLFFETLTQKYPGKLAATHVYPGLVVTPGFYLEGYPVWFRVLRGVVGGFVGWAVGMGREEAGDRMVWTLGGEGFLPRGVEGRGMVMGTDGVRGGGAYAVGRLGEVCQTGKVYVKIRKGDLKERVWEHTMRAFEVIEKGGVFED
ncbi:hypothetical protein DL95DRAFT_445879 [Leptodontidium sp. 2 PMI_412]|nr:hypothetical protein BKA61DRAFT_663264 [Leptodontidium sp. MPI-SDFR-AT-0119]KAH9215597.1 hypothetical protein DL95DRAFT_445879 [Leptodontidium sp. 2 PMI_412]